MPYVIIYMVIHLKNFFDFTFLEFIDYLEKNGYKKYNALQIFDWIYKKRENNFDNMSNLSKNLRFFLKNNLKLNSLKILKYEKSIDTYKFLFQLDDKEYIESVLMIHNYGKSVCISTQVGCNMGCSFCESGKLKKRRNLNFYEMNEQLFLIEITLNIKINSVVLMGIGEPFDNYENVLKFIKHINDSKTFEIGARHITVSTCGIVPKIIQFSNEEIQANLAISLHASNDTLRNKLMKINKVYSIKEIMDSLKYYIKKTNRRVTIEYLLLCNINDYDYNAFELANLLKGLNVYVNLIPYNETSKSIYQKSKKVQILKFYDILKKNNINVTIRKEFGKEISAACGQLRSKEVDK